MAKAKSKKSRPSGLNLDLSDFDLGDFLELLNLDDDALSALVEFALGRAEAHRQLECAKHLRAALAAIVSR